MLVVMHRKNQVNIEYIVLNAYRDVSKTFRYPIKSLKLVSIETCKNEAANSKKAKFRFQ